MIASAGNQTHWTIPDSLEMGQIYVQVFYTSFGYLGIQSYCNAKHLTSLEWVWSIEVFIPVGAGLL